MAESEDDHEAVSIFFLSLFGFAMVAFPLVATVNTAFLDGRLNGALLSVVALVLATPFAFEFAFSRRNPTLVGKFVVTVLVLYVVAILVQAVTFVALGFEEPIPAVQFALLFGTYVLAYLLVYRGGYRRLRGTAAD